MYVPARAIRKRYAISYTCLRTWALQGKVDYKQMPGGVRLYSEEGIQAMFKGPKREEKEAVIYARVSSSHQKEDLERQVQELQLSYPNHRVIKDVGSGLNFERKGLQTLLELIFDRAIQEVVVAYKDRLCRFGFQLFEAICKRFEVRLVVHSREETSSCEQELSEDLLAIINFFVARNNGRRAGKNRKRRRSQVQDKDLEAETHECSEDNAGPVVRSVSVDVQPVC